MPFSMFPNVEIDPWKPLTARNGIEFLFANLTYRNTTISMCVQTSSRGGKYEQYENQSRTHDLLDILLITWHNNDI